MTHLLDSAWLFIHPPLALIGYGLVLLILISALIIWSKKQQRLPAKQWFYAAWLFNLLGLLTGMIWAQLAWNSYWSWDPKETMTLFLFLTISLSVLFYEKRKTTTLVFVLLAFCCVVANVIITLGNFGLHSYRL